MATKAQLISFIISKFKEPSGNPVSKTKLDNMKKSELEEFIQSKGLEDELKEWISTNC